ncbi:MAG TPA: hypothetical protein DC084_14280 [Cupriavidus sp.]|nr:hypothetical protein [Cupriavidus sp.]HBO82385.1 hypothetical protein [Cupriavidus sp.]
MGAAFQKSATRQVYGSLHAMPCTVSRECSGTVAARDLMQAARAFERTTIGAFCIDIVYAVAIRRFLSLPVY